MHAFSPSCLAHAERGGKEEIRWDLAFRSHRCIFPILATEENCFCRKDGNHHNLRRFSGWMAALPAQWLVQQELPAARLERRLAVR
jgi:hypothetical protein